MITLDVRFDAKQALAELSAIGEDVRDRATVRALNRTASTVRAVAAREIGKQLRGAIKIGAIKKAIWIDRAKRGNLVAVVTAKGRKRIPIGEFAFTRTPRGLRTRAPGVGGEILHAFTRPRGGREAVMVRAPTPKGQTWPIVQLRRGRGSRLVPFPRPDLPISELFVPGVPARFVEASVLSAMTRAARARFAQVLDQELRFRRAA